MIKDSKAHQALDAINAAKTFKTLLKYSDTVWYDSANMSRHVIMLMMRFDMILEHVYTCHNAFNAIWYDSKTCSDLS